MRHHQSYFRLDLIARFLEIDRTGDVMLHAVHGEKPMIVRRWVIKSHTVLVWRNVPKLEMNECLSQNTR